MINRISIEEFIQQPTSFPLLDVRTPDEYEKGHIPTATNLPIFSNEDRVKIGTTYKKEGRESAVLLGLELTGPKWRGFVEKALLIAPEKNVVLHCWRGGMRSEAMAWVLHFYGFTVSIIDGGYKKYRNWALHQLEKKYELRILGGMTGSHKTGILLAMKALGEQVIDLEGLANHQGSAFGSMNKWVQPSQEHFENKMAWELNNIDENRTLWMEDESRMIGRCSLSNSIFDQIRSTKVVQLILPIQERVSFLVEEYGQLAPDFLIERTLRIQKRLGPQHAKYAIESIKEGQMKNFIETVLVYYDKMYKNGLERRDSTTVFQLEMNFVDEHQAAKEIIRFSETIN